MSTVAIPVFGTGLSSAGALLPAGSADPNYHLTSAPVAGLVGPAAVLPAGLPSGWVANGPVSQWISVPATAASTAPAGTYNYETTFDLSGLDPAKASLTGDWAAAGLGGNIVLNGTSLGVTTPGPNNLSTFAIPSGFVAGVNKLDFVVNDPGPTGTPTGLRVDLAGTAPPVPFVTITGITPATINENDTTTLSAAISEAGTPTAHTVSIDWGTGQSPTSLSLPAGTTTFSAPHQYLQALPGNAPYNITVTVTDAAGETATGATSVTVDDVAPSNVTAAATPNPVAVGDITTVSGSFSDPGTLDTHTVSVDWGDQSAPSTAPLAAGVLSFGGLTHQYSTVGAFHVGVTVTDINGLFGRFFFDVDTVAAARALVTKIELNTGNIINQVPLPGTFGGSVVSPDGTEKVFYSAKNGNTVVTKVLVATGQQIWQQVVA